MSDTPDASARAMHGLCDEINGAISRGDLSAEAVSELKRAIDETRMRVWSSMEAAKSGDPAWVQEFWMQRAAEVCLSMIQHLERGELNPASPRARDLRAAAERLARSLLPRQGGS